MTARKAFGREWARRNSWRRGTNRYGFGGLGVSFRCCETHPAPNGGNAGEAGDDTFLEEDWDGDGVTFSEGDCDPLDPGEAEARTFYLDADGDGFGDALYPLEDCEPPPDHAEAGT